MVRTGRLWTRGSAKERGYAITNMLSGDRIAQDMEATVTDTVIGPQPAWPTELSGYGRTALGSAPVDLHRQQRVHLA